MRFATVCSGIGAPEVAFGQTSKACSLCHEVKPLEEFHRQPKGKHGRHSQCKSCFNRNARVLKKKTYTKDQKRRWLLATRYRLTPDQVEEMSKAQGHRCAICSKPFKKRVVDHCHKTKKVRGLLCHGCNIKLPAVENGWFLNAARKYLEKYA